MNKRDSYLWLKSIDKITDNIISLIEDQIDITKLIDYKDEDIMKLENINTNIKENIVKYKSHSYFDEIRNKIYKAESDYVSIDDDNYPKNLKHIYNPPKILFYKGDISLINKNISIAMVGARKCTQYGKSVAKIYGKNLSKYNINIVSGLAIGIDSCSHKGCIEGQRGRAIAVLASPIDNILPKSNLSLANDILENDGVIISEFYIGEKVYPSNFVQRNRIISGISDGVMVVEAALKSGALITAELANEQGRNVFAVPGNINSKMSEGCHNIIKQGAKLVDRIDDILEEYNIEQQDNESINFGEIKDLSEDAKVIISLIKEKGSLNIEEICDNTNINIKNINSKIMELKLSDLIIENENNNYSLNT